VNTYPLGTTAPSSDTEHPSYESDVFGFVILWCKLEPHRLGEVGLFVPFEETLIGRGNLGLKGFLRFGRHRPGGPPVIPPIGWCLRDDRISREQLVATAQAGHIDMLVKGGCPTFVNDVLVPKGDRVKLVEGDLVLLKDSALFLVVKRQRIMPALANLSAQHAFGKASAAGMVGESPILWLVQDALALAASRHNHVLLGGESGSGKEAGARAIHLQSSRASRTFYSMNAAAIEKGLFTAEVFGSMANFPNAGMPAREGLLPIADGSTAFLDEVGGLDPEDQTKLCRALEYAEYHKVGESRARRLTTVVVAATSSDLNDLKLDFRNRFARIIMIPPLRVRQEDIPLILRHLAIAEIAQYPDLERFLERTPDGEMAPRVTVDFVKALVRSALPGNVRDLYNLLLLALAQSRGDWIEQPRELALALEAPPSKEPPASEASSAPAQSGRRPKCTEEEIVAALAKAGGRVQAAALMLGVPRTTLRNWMTDYGLRAKEDAG